jgi:hypothetical protein
LQTRTQCAGADITPSQEGEGRTPDDFEEWSVLVIVEKHSDDCETHDDVDREHEDGEWRHTLEQEQITI